MKNAKIKVVKGYEVSEIDERIYGSFVEHMGSVIYTGIFEPGHPQADEKGFRKDVLELIKKLNLAVIRYPGGNFTSGYNWEDTVGVVENRPKRLDLAWRAIEPNTFGLNEFFDWIKLTGASPIMTINLGTRGIDAARNIVEYCNFEGGTYWSDLRRAHGFEKPHDVKMWCLGNELDGHWQIASKSAVEYGRLANETSKAIKLVDDSIETIAVGSSTPRLNSFPEWDREVLMNCYENVDYLSLHNYLDKEQDEDLNVVRKRIPDNTPTYLSRSLHVDRQIKDVIVTCDYVKAVKRSKKTMYLAFDEWNVHHYSEKENEPWKIGSPIDWCHFNMEDTLLFGSMLLSIIRHSDRIKIACQSLLVNTIPLILTDAGGKAWVNPTYYPMMHASLYGRGTLMHTKVDCEKYDSEAFTDVPTIDHVVVRNDNSMTIFVVNRINEEALLTCETQGLNLSNIIEHISLSSQKLSDINCRDDVDRVSPKLVNNSIIEENGVVSKIAPYSWNVIRVKIQNERL